MCVCVGRGISAMPILATSGFPNMRTHSNVSVPSEEMEEDIRSKAPSMSGKCAEEAAGHSPAVPISSDFPDDALFPNKRSPSNLFLGDCLGGAKNKDTAEQTQL